MLGAVRRLFASPKERALRSARAVIEGAAGLEPGLREMDDAELARQTARLRARLAAGDKLDALAAEAFATVREAARRVLGLRPYDVQLAGALVLHRGRIAEMKTGEGKTLVAVLAAYLNALSGRGVHIVTVNDYLARRDSQEMGRIFTFLGMSVGCVVPGIGDMERRLAYAADVTYATNSEVGFDYLRDNMKLSRADMVQRPFDYAIVDEVDSILIDEARTPLVISGQGPDMAAAVFIADRAVAGLPEAAFDIDRKFRTATLTDDGLAMVEARLAAEGVLAEGAHLHDDRHLGLVPFVHQAIRAHTLFERDKDYIVQAGRIVIVDENTGRTMEGRRYSDGLHQALEAKEGVEVLPENVTTASITYQNFFRLYPKLSGMTGTAASEADELAEIYGLEVVPVPTNRPVVRVDREDEIYLTSAERDAAMVRLVAAAHAKGQPVLVGTPSIERSEAVSCLLDAAGIAHAVLNARQHAQEARIVAQAGRPGAVTIATNMAGRGTDIKLGGNAEFLVAEAVGPDADPETRRAVLAQLAPQIEEDARRVREAGGLLVIATGRHESRRVDDQLRGRSGRQGDPGASVFLVSLEDDLMRHFGGEKIAKALAGLGLEPGQPVTHPWVTRAVRKAQRRVEEQNFEIRKNLLKYDAVVNGQRRAFYAERFAVIDGEDVSAIVRTLREARVDELVDAAIPPHAYPEQWDIGGLAAEAQRLFEVAPPLADWAAEEGVDGAEIARRLKEAVAAKLEAIYAGVPPEAVAALERQVLLQCLDNAWKGHLATLEHLREGIGLRAYAQRNPLYEWSVDAAELFGRMYDQAAEHALTVLSRVTLVRAPQPAPEPQGAD